MSGKRFRFSLQRILEIRRREQSAAQQALAQAQRERRRQEERVVEARRDLQTLQEQVPAAQSASVRGLRHHGSYCQDQRRACRALCDELDALRQQEATAQRHLMEARRTVEGLEILRDQEKAQHETAQANAEAAFLDEQAVMRHRRTSQTALL